MDTNFLLLPYQFKIDVFSELEHVIGEPFIPVISSRILSELRGISKKVGKAGAAARFALKLIDYRKDKIKIVDSKEPVDDWVFIYSNEHRAIACTNDAQLKRRLKAEKMNVIGLRTRAKLGYV